MIIHRDIGPSYHHKPIVQGVNYSPLMVESKEVTLVKEKRWREAIPVAVPPPIFLQRRTSAFVSWFLCFSAASSWEHLGDHFIVGFRSRQGEPRENRRHRTLEAKTSLGGVAW
jgi:hypothetical protein